MKILKILPAAVLLLFILNSNALSQCKTFAKTSCLPALGEYTHDGNYHATVLVEGEEAELYKTFYSDMEYRVSVCGQDNLPPVEFKVLDANSNVLFSSKEENNAKTWDFNLQSSQQLKIVLKVGNSDQQGVTPASGCVAIMFGFKIKK
jgi:hypothetical protein